MASLAITLQKGYMLLLLLTFSTWISAISINVCSSFNTAETPLNVSIYQTNGACGTFCTKKDYAFSITQQNSCWCSNYYPDKTTQVDVKECNDPCPAWPSENCGGPGLYGYILLNEVAPSGTKTAPPTSAPTQSTASTSATTASSSTTTSTSTSASASSSSSTSETSTTSSSSSSSSTTDSSSSSSSTSFSTSTTSTTPPPGQTSDDSSPSQDPSGDRQTGTPVKHSGLSTGAIVGIVVGVVGGLLFVCGAAFLLYRRRRQNRNDEYRDDPSVRGSSSGMVGSVPPEMSANSGSPASPVSAVNRNSTIQIDPRMDPFKQGLYIRGSHESLNTIRDDHDYSRRIHPPVLRAMNPDPEE
ncbi:cell wall integrity and stress response component [Trichoderma harzianum]|uniref:Cell wall integrity and stress response component n=1 Tax=Trichoderma harzianum TaxID=5544 RepID=A0A0F9Z994_TRIHA|nr:cell wall integrity and stress response component [Trichoderma harzianum]